MKENRLNLKLKNNHADKNILFLGILGIVIYKIWKYVVSLFLPYGESSFNYYAEQSLYTFYRIIATLIGAFLLGKFYKEIKSELGFGAKKYYLANFLVLIPFWFLIHYLFVDSKFYLSSFKFELVFNLFTGSFEEIFFRGLILVGLSQYFNKFKSILMSSLIFTIWHYDVVNYQLDYLAIFIFSIYFGLCYLNGSSLLSLVLIHFLWDQVVFGFYWGRIGNLNDYQTSNIILIADIILTSSFTFYFFRKQLGEFRLKDLK